MFVADFDSYFLFLIIFVFPYNSVDIHIYIYVCISPFSSLFLPSYYHTRCMFCPVSLLYFSSETFLSLFLVSSVVSL